MGLSIGWIIFIVVVIFGILISNIMLLKQSNKDFVFPDSYEKSKNDKKSDDDDDEPSSLI